MSKFWKETTRVKVLERLRNTLILPAFCVRCGEDNSSVHFPGLQVNGPDYLYKEYPAGGDAFSLKSEFSIEAWLKTISGGVVFANVEANSIQNNIYIQLIDQKILIILRKAGVDYTLTSANFFPSNEWFHLGVTYIAGTIRIYVNGVQDDNVLFLAPNLEVDVGNNYSTNIGGSSVLGVDYNFIGKISEVRIWSEGLTREQIEAALDHRRGKMNGLQRYYKLNQSTIADLDDFLNALGPLAAGSLTSAIEIDDESYPPLVLGGSRMAAKFEISGLEQKISFKYPTNRPTNANFMLCVAWLEEDETTYSRRRLWDLDGVVIHPMLPARYRGEKLPTEFRLEVWSVDGASNVELEEDLVIRTSHTTIPATQIDEEEPELLDGIEINYSIYESFGNNFPWEFEENTNGTCEAPIDLVPADMSANLTVYGNIQ